MDSNLPYKIEYTPKEAPGHCKKCRRVFIHRRVRVGEMTQSKKHDYKYPMWYHRRCFFETHRPKATSQFQNFERMKHADQLEVIKIVDKKFEKFDIKKFVPNQSKNQAPSILNFGIEYSSSSAEKCAVCKDLIGIKELRIKKIDFQSETASKYGKDIFWHHLECFIKQREKIGFVFAAKQLPGYKDLKEEHKKIINDALPSLIAEAAEEAAESLKKLNLSSQDDSSDTECENDNLPLDPESAIEIMIAQQSEELLRVRAALKKTCTKDELIKLLAYNDSAPVDGFDNLLDRCADFLTFGALYNCQKCSKGDMIFTKHGYTCNGMIDEWVKCGNQEKEPMRLKCFIPSSLEDNNFFLTCEQKISTRAVRPKVLRDEDEASTSSKYQPTTSSTLKRVASIKFKEGTVVDPRSKLVDTTHVYKYKDTLFESVLCLIDIQKDRNSYFKLQVLETDRDQSKIGYFLFTSWGRIGTDIGSSKVEDFSSPIDACRKFEKLFEEKTSNSWKTRGKFIRQPNKFYPVEVTYNEGIKTNTTTASKLSASVEELMKLLFNVQNMTRTMKSFKLDLDKMPLGKLSVQQLKLARLALDELKQAVDEKDESKLIGLSNKFYTLVPHSFGLFKARVIETNADIVKKHEMIDSLMDIQKAYGIMLKTTPSNDVNSFDAYYKRLNAEITAVDPKSRGYELIERYVANTQVHGIKLKVLEVFMVKRNGEKERYEKYKKLDNRMLLWHGSRLTNFTSILSNGLTIGAVANGSMFGRGIYFADMVSKSSQYCAPTPPDNIGLLALSEVALGNIHELNQGMNLNQPPAGKDSVKGVGRTQPNLKYAHKRKDGVVIPLGRPYKEGQQAAATRSLIHNEYIVYNEAQVNLQYLVKLQIG